MLLCTRFPQSDSVTEYTSTLGGYVGKHIDYCLVSVMVVADLFKFKSILTTILFMLSNGFSPLNSCNIVSCYWITCLQNIIMAV